MEHFQNAVVALVEHYGYLGLFVGLVLGNVGFPAGAEVLVPVAAALIAHGNAQRLGAVVVVALCGELVGGTIGYAVGRYGGRTVAERYGRYVGFHHERLGAVDAFFRRWGSFAVFLCRFVPVLRGLSPFVAGIGEMPLLPFYVWTFLGSLLFCGGLALLGNAVGAHVNELIPALRHWGRVMLIAAAVAIVCAAVLLRLRRTEA